MRKNALIIFTKKPGAGKVKTRLYPELSYEEAADFYSAMVRDIVSNLYDSPEYETFLFFYPENSRDYFENNFNGGIKLCAQNGGGIGERMEIAFSQLFRAGYNKIILIGSDCPALSAEDINQAFNLLDSHDIVIGPAEDGGYYLIGLTDNQPWIFQDMHWSTKEVLEQTLNRIYNTDKKHILIDQECDIDSISDLRRLFLDIENQDITLNIPNIITFRNRIEDMLKEKI